MPFDAERLAEAMRALWNLEVSAEIAGEAMSRAVQAAVLMAEELPSIQGLENALMQHNPYHVFIIDSDPLGVIRLRKEKPVPAVRMVRFRVKKGGPIRYGPKKSKTQKDPIYISERDAKKSACWRADEAYRNGVKYHKAVIGRHTQKMRNGQYNLYFRRAGKR